MPLYRAQVVLAASSNLPRDVSTNTFYFDVDGDSILGPVSQALASVYQSLATRFSTLVPQNGHKIKFYRMSDAEPRAVVLEAPFNLTSAPTSPPMPPECAICISFQGEASSGVNQARRRGRIYFGPLGSPNCGPDGYVPATVLTVFATAFGTLLDASQAAANWTWAVYSTVNASGVPVTDGWINNEIDTQRRRGRVATSRTTFI